jgi:hypothetical protein
MRGRVAKMMDTILASSATGLILSTILSKSGVYISARQQIAQQCEVAFFGVFQAAASANRQL